MNSFTENIEFMVNNAGQIDPKKESQDMLQGMA
jgi:hypothetical protein